ncbi:MAG: EamA family transporter [Ferrovibrio sp.]|uniref:EamA family transporter n=1 Tax=Ferrovibrio sp. TaxID=1917215 RepID=UPI00260A8A4D|nr:EamA family transporter [Ferrovibrio sp.]MCW0234578.1 EamA family transporter [Ferrovibrio sp.]
MKGAGLLLGFAVCTLLGNFFFKRGAGEIASLAFGWDMAGVVVKSANAWAGALFYGFAAAFWFLALSVVPMNLAITVSACVYVFVVLLAFFIFREPIPLMRWAGIGLIFVGIVFVGRTV